MKIIFSHYGVIDGGDASGFTRSFALSSGLASLGNKVVFLTTQKKGFSFPFSREFRDGVEIIAFPDIFPYRLRKGGVALLSTLLKIIYIIFNKADIVQADMGHRPTSGLPCILHRLIYKSIYIAEWWEHYGPSGIYDEMPFWYRKTIGFFDKLFEERSRLVADGCVPISHKLFERALMLGYDKEDLLILNGGSDINKISFCDDSSIQKIKFGLPVENYIIAIIGLNDDEFKNNRQLIDAIINHNTKTLSRKITVIGTGKLSKLYDNKAFGENIKIFKWLEYKDFCNLISSADAFTLMLSDTVRNKSRFPNKLGDYLAAGRPIIANKVGEVKIYIEKYPWLFYNVDDENNINLADLLQTISVKKDNKQLFKDIRLIAEENSWEDRAIKLQDFYIKILTTKQDKN